MAGLRPEDFLSLSELLLPSSNLHFTDTSESDFVLFDAGASDLVLLEVTEEAEESLADPDFDFPLLELLSESDEFLFSDSEPESSWAH